MPLGSRTFIKALLAMTGTIIGAGVFGLPAAFARVGFWPGTFLFFFLTLAVALTHALYVAIILKIPGKKHLAEYAKHGLGETAHAVASVTFPLHIIGSNVAYIILGGEFSALLADAIGLSLPLSLWQILFWLSTVTIVYYGLRSIALVESYATLLLLVTMVVAIVLVWPSVVLSPIAQLGSWENLALPFGVFLFTLSGLSVVTEVVEITKRSRVDAYGSVILGTVVASLFSYIFGVALYLASRGFPVRSSTELIALLPSAWAWIVPLLGLLAIITSYITSAESLRSSLVTDVKLKPKLAMGLALLTPFIIFTITTRDFLSVIGFVGAVLIAINYLIVCLIGWKMASGIRSTMRRLSYSVVCILLMSVFAFGMLQKLFSRTNL